MKKIKSYLQEYSYLKSIQSLLHWDMETMMPSGAIEDRAKRLSYVQGKIHAHITSPEYSKLLKEFSKKKKMSGSDKILLKELKWDYDLNYALPSEHVEAQSICVQRRSTRCGNAHVRQNPSALGGGAQALSLQ